ncbi:MAG: ABC transporter permease [Proteobacteria bacterium]|nr:ABC transporter permease [Pseudomonadota bacterium]MCP4916603.1 ABC transporter permease [Pseudomonadota bacterium]
MSFLFSVAWRNLFRHKRRTFLTASAMGIAVAMCLMTVTFSDGIYAMMSDALVTQNLGHVQLHDSEYPSTQQPWLTIDDALLQGIDGVEGVEAVTGRLYGHALMGSDEKSSGVKLIGVVPTREEALSPLSDRMKEGTFLTDDSRGVVVLGIGLAEELEVTVGDEVVIIGQATDGSMANELLEVTGIVTSGRAMVDRGAGYVHLEDLQAILALEGQVHEILVIGASPDVADPLKAGVESVDGTSELLVRTWNEADPTTAQMLSMQNVGILIFVVIIFGVAALGILNTMLMAVFERVREFGLMKALGLTPPRIVALVLMEASLLGGLALLFGGILGGIFDWYSVVYGIDMGLEGMEQMGVRFDPVVRGVIRPGAVAAVLASLFSVCIVAAIWPAIRAARLNPVESMRSL